MNITGIKVREIFHGTMVKALVSITINGDFTVHDIKIVEGRAGRLYVAMPSLRGKDGVYRDVVHPIGSEARQALETQILSLYDEHLESAYFPETAVVDV